MRNMIKSLVFGLALSSVVAKADTVAISLNGSSPTNSIIQGPGKLNSISISSLATTNGTLYFYDSAYNTNTYTRGGWTNISYSVGLNTNIFTNVFGVLSTNYYTAKILTTNTIAKAVVARPLIATATTVSNSVVTLDFDGVFFGSGLLLTNVGTIGGLGGVNITVNYDDLR